MNAAPATPDRCPRCGRSFVCGAASSGPCACTTVTLGVALQARLRSQFQGCLCLDCLKVLAAADAAAEAPPPRG